MKILVLDVDGVLCTQRSHLAYAKRHSEVWDKWDDLAATAIRRACGKGPRIIISSTWRYADPALLATRLAQHGLTEYLLYPGDLTKNFTPSFRHEVDDMRRGKEVEAWLAKNPDVEDYRILDDIPDEFLPDQMPKLIQTDPEDGMSSGNIRELYSWAKVG